LGFAASVDIGEGLARYVDWVRSVPRPTNSGLEAQEARNWQLAAVPNA
jgi:hypothetical protein